MTANNVFSQLNRGKIYGEGRAKKQDAGKVRSTENRTPDSVGHLVELLEPGLDAESTGG